jgi:hypothetical protein
VGWLAERSLSDAACGTRQIGLELMSKRFGGDGDGEGDVWTPVEIIVERFGIDIGSWMRLGWERVSAGA